MTNFFPTLWDAVENSSLICLLTFALIVPLAYFNTKTLSQYRFKHDRLLEGFSLAILIVPTYVFAIVYRELFSVTGPLRHLLSHELLYPLGHIPIQSSLGFSFCAALSLYPLVFAIFRPLHQFHLGTNTVIASNLGLSNRQRRLRITLPYFGPALFLCILLIVSSLIGDYSTAQVLGVRTLSTFLYNAWFTAYEQMALVRMSLLFGGLIFIIFGFFVTKGFGRRRYLGRDLCVNKKSLAKNREFRVYFFLTLPILWGLVVPGIILLKWATETIDYIRLDRFSEIISESFFISGSITTLIVLICASSILVLRKYKNNIVLESLFGFLSTGYVLPSLSLAFLTLWGLNGFVSSWNSRLPILLQIAEVVKFLGPALFLIILKNQQIPLQMDWSLKMFRVPFLRKMKLFFFPYFSTVFLLTSAFVFIESFKESIFPLTLRPFTYSTLSVESYMLISNNNFKESAILILSMGLCSIYPIVIFVRSLKDQLHEN